MGGMGGDTGRREGFDVEGKVKRWGRTSGGSGVVGRKRWRD